MGFLKLVLIKDSLNISTLAGYLMPKLAEENKEVHTFPKCISSKVNKIVQQEFELDYFEAAGQHFIHYTIHML